MKKLLLLLVGACLISNVLAQHPTRKVQEPLRRAVVGGKVVNISENEDAFLFYQLPGEPRARDVSKLSFVLHEDAKIYLVERVTLDSPDNHTEPSIQFLAGEPARLAELLDMARQPGHHFSLMIRANGEVIREFAFEEFLAYNGKLKRQPGFHPVHVSAQVTLFKWPHAKGRGSSGIQPEDLTCTQECDIQYGACAQDACGDPQSICGPCLDAWQSCRDACPQICVPYSYQVGSPETYAVSCSVVGSGGCYYSPFLGHNTVQYYGYCLTVTYTHYHHVNCDGTEYNTTDTSYDSEFAWVDTGISC